jgi:hypothetical protein
MRKNGKIGKFEGNTRVWSKSSDGRGSAEGADAAEHERGASDTGTEEIERKVEEAHQTLQSPNPRTKKISAF